MNQNYGATGAIIVAAGKGSRMGLGYNKVLSPLCGKPVIEWTLQAFAKSGLIDQMVLVVGPEDLERMKEICKPYIDKIDIAIALGGAARQESVYNGLLALKENIRTVLIHDGARPFVDEALIKRSVENAVQHGAVCAGMPVKDTIKIVDEANSIISTPERKFVWSAQTPQAFKKEIILKAFENAFDKGIKGTDDAGLAEAAGFKVTMFEGSYSNIKLTSTEDLILAESLMSLLK